MRARLLLVAAIAMSLLACEEVVDKVIQAETGCTESQLGEKMEPDLPNCSKAIACCKFIKGECGNIQLFDAPESVIELCNENEALLSSFVDTYRELEEDDCPDYLEEEECSQGYDETKQSYIDLVDGGEGELADMSPSCKMIVDETVTKLNDALGDSAKYLPEDCTKL